uniref:PAS domain-containing protein n=1 Tax=Pedobacter schmidteae TaxID=2201271 RepID=UPI000EAD53E6|nr:PAS domain-containing protein [Pedobacter schmidteae]
MLNLDDIEYIFNSLPTASIIVEPDAPYFTVVAVNRTFLEIVNAEREDFVGKGFFEGFPVKPDDDGHARASIKGAFEEVLAHKHRHHIKEHRYDLESGTQESHLRYWKVDTYPLLDDDGSVKYIIQSSEEITLNKRSNDFALLEKEVLALNAKPGVSTAFVLTYYVNGIEALFPQMKCSIMQVKNNRLYGWATPSLPAAYSQQIEGLEIGENVGSCGTSAFLQRNIIVSDIENDTRWASFAHVALQYNLRACWSQPIINSEGVVMATFAIYYHQVKEPNADELSIIERASSLLQVLLENRQYAELLNDATLLMTQGQELAHFGTWSWDIQNNVVKWSDSLFSIYGLNKDEFKATFEGYQELLHPDDRKFVYDKIQNVLRTHQDTEFEERIIRPDGELRYLKSWGKLKLENGLPVKMIGACLDITQVMQDIQERTNYIHTIEQQNHQLRDIAWAQTHLVRAPLARIMGIVELLSDSDTDAPAEEKLLAYLDVSAKELDKAIKQIISKIRK